MLDEDVKGMFEHAEALLITLRQLFKTYQKKNQKKVEQSELEARSKNITILRKQLNLL